MPGHLVLDKGGKTYLAEKTASLTQGAGKTRYFKRLKLDPLTLGLPQNKFKIYQRPKYTT